MSWNGGNLIYVHYVLRKDTRSKGGEKDLMDFDFPLFERILEDVSLSFKKRLDKQKKQPSHVNTHSSIMVTLVRFRTGEKCEGRLCALGKEGARETELNLDFLYSA